MDPLLAVGAPLALALVELVRPTLPERTLPLASLAAGWLVAVLVALSGSVVWTDVPLGGLMVGLAASGLYSGGRTIAGIRKEDKHP